MSQDDTEDGVSVAPPLPGGNPGMVEKKPRRRVRKRWILLSIGTALLSFVAAIVAVGVVLLMGRSVAVPDWLTREVEARLNSEFQGEGIDIARIRVGLLDDELRPTVELQGVRLRNAQPMPLMALPSLQVKLDTSELLQGRFALETLNVRDARINLTRDRNGEFAFAFDSDLGGSEFSASSVAEMMTLIDEGFAHSALRELEEVNVSGVTLTLDDMRLEQRVVIEDGQLSVLNEESFLAMDVAFDISMDNAEPSTLILSVDKAKGASGGRVQAEFSQLRMRDVAEQFSALNFLTLLDAPVEGQLTSEFGEEGELVSFAGGLNVGPGAVQPAPQAKPLPLNSAEMQLRYSSATQRLHMEGLKIDAPELRVTGQGYADLQDFVSGIPSTLLTQIRLADIRLDPEGMFETPVSFEEGQIDLRYRPEELDLDIGQLVLRHQGSEILASGDVSVGADGWLAAVDAEITEIAQQDLLALWPTGAVHQTRDWLTQNVRSGDLKHAAAAIRVVPGQPPDAAVTFNFEEANVRYVKTLPVVEEGRGYVTIAKNEMTLVIHEGYVTPPQGGRLDVGGSIMQIPDIEKKIPDAEISLRARGPIEAALSLLDEKPFEFLTKADVTPDIVAGQADVTARLFLPLAKDLKVEEVGYRVDAELRDVQSTELVKDRELLAQTLSLNAEDDILTIAGDARLDTVPVTFSWERSLRKEDAAKGSTVAGTVALSQASLNAFGIDIPAENLRGESQGQFTLALSQDADPRLQLTSDLEGITLSVEALAWSKPAAVPGRLSLSARLGETPDIEKLDISGAGLDATGRVSLKPGGGFDRATFSSLTVPGRLKSAVTMIGQGAGVPALLQLRGGTVDIRRFGVGQGGAGRGGGAPLDLALDRLIITDDVAITDFQGQFRNRRGIDGGFRGRVNGGAAISGTVVPTERGLAVRIQSEDGGRVLASSGIFRNARGGDMTMVLQPTGRAGEFDGRLSIANTRIKKAPALADLLSALSVVGLIEQLSGDGILFSEVEAFFTLSAGGVRLRESRAVGPSMGITMDGVYSTTQRRMQMQGVVSPLYLVNRPLGFLFSKKGEGLFGFTYTLDGAADAPQVGVNPLSVFTPGVFRDIFRRSPPPPRN